MTEISKQTAQGTPGQVSMMQAGGTALEQNKEVARRFVNEVLNRQDLNILDQIMAEDTVLYHPVKGKQVKGLQEVRRFIQSYFTAFPDMKLTIDTLVAEGDHVAVYVTCEGTQKASFATLPASNQKLAWIAINILTIRNGRIVEQRACDDVVQQIEATC